MKRKMMLMSLSVLLVLVFASGVVYGFNQSPILTKRVANGELEPVDQRLPEEPVVVKAREEIGKYGGSWLSLISDPEETKLVTVWSMIDLYRWGPDLEPMPDLAYKYEVSDDLKTYTFYLREGVKWSDGEPFTAEDIVFKYQATLNEELFPSGTGWFADAVVEKIDDYTVQFKFEEPAPDFMDHICSNRHALFAPAHYLKQFHKDFADPEELEKLVAESGSDSWVDLFNSKFDDDCYTNHNLDMPRMNPWVPTVEPPAERFVFKRNPYFYKVDEEGNQLPYIDELVMKLVSDQEVLNIQTAAGVPDFQSRGLTIENFSLYKTNEDKGDYKVLLWNDDITAKPAIYANQTCNDPVLRELNQNVKFRQALSLGINRPQINQVIYKGLGKPMQFTAPTVSKFYKDEYAEAYAEYNPERANKLLDEIELDKKNSKGYRLMSNGEPLSITIYTHEANKTNILELIKDTWEDLGIKVSIKQLERTLFRLRVRGGEGEYCEWNAAGLEMMQYAPLSVSSYQGPKWSEWFESDGEEGIEPPAEQKELYEVTQTIEHTVDPEKRAELWDKLLKSQAENVWVIGTVGEIPNPLVKKNHFRNVPEKSIYSWGYGGYYGPAEPYQFFIDKE